jgi:hypothetical protein
LFVMDIYTLVFFDILCETERGCRAVAYPETDAAADIRQS